MRVLLMSLVAAASLGLACTSAEDPSQEPSEDLVDDEPEFISGVSERTGPALCGGLAFEPTGPWQAKGERLEGVRGAWHPRPEYGRPIALRPATPPFAWADYDFFEVEVMGARNMAPVM